MRTKSEIEARIRELENFQQIANERLEQSIREGNQKGEIYWGKTVTAFEAQIYGMKFSIGECE